MLPKEVIEKTCANQKRISELKKGFYKIFGQTVFSNSHYYPFPILDFAVFR